LTSLSTAKLAALSESPKDKSILLPTVLIQNALRANTYESYVERSTSNVEYSHVEYASSLGSLAEEDEEETEVEVEEVTFDDDFFDYTPYSSPIPISSSPRTTMTVEPAFPPSYLDSHFSARREAEWFEQCMADLDQDQDDFFSSSPSPPSSTHYSLQLISPRRSESLESVPSLHDEDCESCAGSDSDDDLEEQIPLAPPSSKIYFAKASFDFKSQDDDNIVISKQSALHLTRPRVIERPWAH
jgi:hypothetical protein